MSSTQAAGVLEAWQLTGDGEPLAAGRGLVLPVVTEDRQRAVLKLAFAEGWHGGSIHALKSGRGRGTPELLRAAPAKGWVLLERLEERWLDAEDHARVAAELWSVLHRPAPAAYPRLAELVASALAGVDDRVPRSLASQAKALFDHLQQEPRPEVALHGALHPGHVLWRGDEAVAVGAWGVAGEAEAEAAGAFWTESVWGGPVTVTEVQDRFWTLADALAAAGSGADERRMRDWALVVAVARAAGAVDERLTHLVTVAKGVGALQV